MGHNLNTFDEVRGQIKALREIETVNDENAHRAFDLLDYCVTAWSNAAVACEAAGLCDSLARQTERVEQLIYAAGYDVYEDGPHRRGLVKRK